MVFPGKHGEAQSVPARQQNTVELGFGLGFEQIKNVAARCGISEDDLELYGKYKAKISDEYITNII